MTINYIRRVFEEDERGLPICTDQERSAEICDWSPDDIADAVIDGKHHQ